jgi:ferrochelatase
MFAEAIAAAAVGLPAAVRDHARLVFTAHSIPVQANSRCGVDLYSRQVGYAAALIAAAAGYREHDQVWQSRSGPPRIPWLEPDVSDHVRALAAAGTPAVIVCPVGFVADHIEVVWDLDEELRLQAQDAGIAFARAATPNADRRFARLAVDLVDELRTGRQPERVSAPNAVPLRGPSVNGAPCAQECVRAR